MSRIDTNAKQLQTFKDVDKNRYNVNRALEGNGAGKTVKPIEADTEMALALKRAGISYDELAQIMKRLLHMKKIKVNKQGKVREEDDGIIQLKALEFCVKQLMPPPSKTHQHVHLHGETVDELFDKVRDD